MIRIIFFSILMSQIATQHITVTCMRRTNDTKCFWLVNDVQKSFDDATQHCNASWPTSHLAWIENQTEYDVVKSYFQNEYPGQNDTWIGAKSYVSATWPSIADFHWVNGQTNTTILWYPIPNTWLTDGGTDTDCGYMAFFEVNAFFFYSRTYFWGDKMCSDQIAFLCQHLVLANGTPSTTQMLQSFPFKNCTLNSGTRTTYTCLDWSTVSDSTSNYNFPKSSVTATSKSHCTQNESTKAETTSNTTGTPTNATSIVNTTKTLKTTKMTAMYGVSVKMKSTSSHAVVVIPSDSTNRIPSTHSHQTANGSTSNEGRTNKMSMSTSAMTIKTTAIKLFTEECGLKRCLSCVQTHTAQCSQSTQCNCACKIYFKGSTCQHFNTDIGCRNGGTMQYNETHDTLYCSCPKCFKGVHCELPDGYPTCNPSQMLGEAGHVLGCTYVVIMLSMAVVFGLLFDRSEPFGWLKINGNVALLSAHILILFFDVPFVLNLSSSHCNLVAAAVSYFHSVFFVSSAMIALHTYCFMTGCMLSGMVFNIPLIYWISFAWVIPLFYTAVIASLYFPVLSTNWTCIQNFDVSFIPLLLLCWSTIFLILEIVFSEAAGQDEFWITGCLESVNRRNLLSAKVLREGMYLSHYTLATLLSYYFTSIALYTMQTWAYVATLSCNTYFATLLFSTQVIADPSTCISAEALLKRYFGWIPVVRKWNPTFDYKPSTPLVRDNIQRYIEKKIAATK